MRQALTLVWKSLFRPVALGLARVFLRGDTVACPCCQRTYRSFFPHHGRKALCPSCSSLERQRTMCLYLRRHLDGQPGGRVLHFAPEGSVRAVLKDRADVDYVSVDLYSPEAMHRMDITQLGFPDESFDLILCSHVLEHVVDDALAASELYRVLKPTGMAVIQVPIDGRRTETLEDPSVTSPRDRERLFGQSDHVRIYGRDFIHRLKRAGFEVDVDRFPPEVARRYGLEVGGHMNGEDLHLCTKRAD